MLHRVDDGNHREVGPLDETGTSPEMTPGPISAELEAYVRREHVDFRTMLAALTADVAGLDAKVGAVLTVAAEVKAQAVLTNGRVGVIEAARATEAAVLAEREAQVERTRVARAAVLAEAVDARQAVELSYAKIGGMLAFATFMLSLVVLFSNGTLG